MTAKLREWYEKWKGPVGHTATGLLVGSLLAVGLVQFAVIFTVLVQFRQAVSWLHKRDKVGRDLQEHLQAAIFGFIAVPIADWQGKLPGELQSVVWHYIEHGTLRGC